MCVRRFDDSLNSAIHNTLSRFATVFIDARAKGSTVGSCISNFQCLKIAKTKHNTPIRQKSFVSCPPKEGLKLSTRGQRDGAHRGKRRQTRAIGTPVPFTLTPTPQTKRKGERVKKEGKHRPEIGNGNDPSAGSPTETLLRLLLPLDDQAGMIFQKSRASIADHPSSDPKLSLKPSNR